MVHSSGRVRANEILNFHLPGRVRVDEVLNSHSSGKVRADEIHEFDSCFRDVAGHRRQFSS
jgi:hypothetical protein